MKLIQYRALRTFLNSQVLPDQLGGQFPEIRIMEGTREPHLEFEVREGKKDKRLLVVGIDWLVQQTVLNLLELKDKYS